ncbi:MAG: 2-amino-4-hydroxy-6-hydroxymethyldihydropteridine diphosphokinase [Bacteroidota bacterium]
MAKLLIQLGSNIEPREIYLARARVLCDEKLGNLTNQSSMYQTAAWGRTDQADFLNQVIEIETDYNPEDCLTICQEIEQKLGRERHEHWGPRTIDIDLLVMGNRIVDTKDLILPHPRLAVRRFVLVPLCEVAPKIEHPLLKRSMRRLLTACRDDGKVLRWLRT